MIELNEHLQFLLSATLVAILGGIANWLMSDDHSVFQFMAAIFLAGFAGFLVGELCVEYKLSQSAAFFFCGAAGLCAELILKIARRSIITKMSVLTDQSIVDELALIEASYKRRKKERNQKKKSDNFGSE